MTWAWSMALPPTSKLMLMALADIADDLGVCQSSLTFTWYRIQRWLVSVLRQPRPEP